MRWEARERRAGRDQGAEKVRIVVSSRPKPQDVGLAKKVEKSWKKCLTFGFPGAILAKRSRERRTDFYQANKIWKNLKKVLDKRVWMWYPKQAVAREPSGSKEDSGCTLKIEQCKKSLCKISTRTGLYMEHIYDSEILLRAGKRIKSWLDHRADAQVF